MEFQIWLETEQEAQKEQEESTKIERLLALAKKIEEYGFGVVKFGKNMASIPQTMVDLLQAAKKYQEAKKAKDQETLVVAREELRQQMNNAMKLPMGGVLSGIPYVGLKAAALFAHTPALIIAAVIAMAVYYLSYYTMTVANDLSKTAGSDKRIVNWLVRVGGSLSKLMPDRMRAVMMPDKKQEAVWNEIDQLILEVALDSNYASG